jgi:hypothetical protein
VNQPELTPELKLAEEMALLQSRFDKYDSQIYTARGWMVTLVSGIAGVALDRADPRLLLLAAVIVAAAAALEFEQRRQWAKYVHRYEHLRALLQNSSSDWKSVVPFDLTNYWARRGITRGDAAPDSTRDGEQPPIEKKTKCRLVVFYLASFAVLIAFWVLLGWTTGHWVTDS